MSGERLCARVCGGACEGEGCAGVGALVGVGVECVSVRE